MKLFSPRRFGVVLAVVAALVPLGSAGAGAAPPSGATRAAASTLSVPGIDDVRGNLTLRR